MRIHQVKTRLVNSYVVEYADKLFVMDVAIRCHKEVALFIEETLQRDLNDVELVFCSHDDPDHIGGLNALATMCNAKIAIPYASNSTWRKLINDPSATLTRLKTSLRELFRARAWDMYFNPARFKKAKAITQGYESTTGQNATDDATESEFKADYRLKNTYNLPGFDDWQVIHTPGHSWDSCCYYHSQSDSLLSGDTLLGSGKKNRLVAPAIYANKRDMIRTLKRLSEMHIKHVYPGHGSVISGDGIIENTKLQ